MHRLNNSDAIGVLRTGATIATAFGDLDRNSSGQFKWGGNPTFGGSEHRIGPAVSARVLVAL